jgi:hypothetical protein
MTIIYRTTGAWGAGKGANLTPAEVDDNFYDLEQRVDSLETTPPEAVSIDTIDVTGNLMTITLTDARALGPFILPAARFRWTGVWQPGLHYFENDVFTYNLEIYVVLVEHDADATFDATRFDSIGFYYQLMLAIPEAFIDIGFFFPGPPGTGIEVGDPILAFRAVRDFYLPTDLTSSRSGFRSLATHDVVLSLRKNDSEIGTWSSDAGFVFTADVQFAAGDVLSVHMTEALQYDETARDLTITLVGVRGLIP